MITYINLGKNGHLGNQLFQIASCIGMADKQEVDVGFPEWGYMNYFSVPTELFGHSADVDMGLDYLQDLRHFKHINERILEYFKPSKRAIEILNKVQIVKEPGPKIGVHIRRGDYLSLPNHFPIPSLDDYYKPAISQIISEVGKSKVFVFTNDPEWCGYNVPAEWTVIQGNESWVDMFLLNAMDHIVMANSTFSWWAAYLSLRKRIIYRPQQWYGPELNHVDISNLFPTEWRYL